MRSALTICRKELQMYFYSPIAYAAFAVYFFLSSIFFSLDFLFGSKTIDARIVMGNIMLVLLFIIPLLTMRLVADEFRQGTDELLFTSPASIMEIILGKYMAALSVQFLLVLFSLIYPLIMSRYGELDLTITWLTFLSMFLLGAAMMSVGLFASTLTSHQMVSGIIGFALILMLWLIDFVADGMYGKVREIVEQFSLINRTVDFQKGILNLNDLIFYILFTAVFLFLSVQVLERKRWR